MKRVAFVVVAALVLWNLGIGFLLVREIGRVDRFYSDEVAPAVRQLARLRELSQESFAQQRCLYNFILEDDPQEMRRWEERLAAARGNTDHDLAELEAGGVNLSELRRAYETYVQAADDLQRRATTDRLARDEVDALRYSVRPALDRYLSLQQSLARELEDNAHSVNEAFSAHLGRERQRLSRIIAIPAVVLGVPLLIVVALWGSLILIAMRGTPKRGEAV